MTGIRAFSAPTRIVAGLGSAKRLAELEALSASNVAVACDARIFVAHDAAALNGYSLAPAAAI
jgi:hypothetical protein